MLLGNLAVLFPGTKLMWDGPKMRVTNLPEANEFVQVNERGVWATEREAVVTFVCEEVLDVALQGFSPQNVISRLDLE